MVEVILGVMTACCNGENTASEVTVNSIGPRLTGVAWTATKGSGSFSGALQPANRAAARSSRLAGRVCDFKVFFTYAGLPYFMELSALLLEFGDWRGRCDNAQRHRGKHCWPWRRWFAHRPLREPWIHRFDTAR